MICCSHLIHDARFPCLTVFHDPAIGNWVKSYFHVFQMHYSNSNFSRNILERLIFRYTWKRLIIVCDIKAILILNLNYSCYNLYTSVFNCLFYIDCHSNRLLNSFLKRIIVIKCIRWSRKTQLNRKERSFLRM